MWVAIWLVLSCFLLSFVGWTLYVLLQQKRAWKAFAEKNNLSYRGGKMMESPTVQGHYGKRMFSMYTDIQPTKDVRGQRYVSVIEFQMGDGMPTGAIIATKELREFSDHLIFHEIYVPDLKEWSPDYISKTRDKKNLKEYLTDDRARILSKLFKMKNAVVLFFFDELDCVLRVETTDPLRNAAHLQKIVEQIFKVVQVLTPGVEEKKRFKQLLKEEKKRRETAHPDDDDEDEVESLEENVGTGEILQTQEAADEKSQEPAVPLKAAPEKSKTPSKSGKKEPYLKDEKPKSK